VTGSKLTAACVLTALGNVGLSHYDFDSRE
jgi:hypothetical protein